MSSETGDKRRLDRVRTLLAAQAVLGRGLPDTSCQIKDLSDTGARLLVDEKAFLPDRFELRIPKRGTSHVALVRWRHGNLVGVQFEPDRREKVRIDPDARIRQLEAENAELRRRVADMADRLFSYGDTERPLV